MQENNLNNIQQVPPMSGSGEQIPYKDLENPEQVSQQPQQVIQNQNPQPKPKNKIVKTFIIIAVVFVIIVATLFILSIFYKKSQNPKTEQKDETVQIEQPKESTISAIPSQITDKYKEIEGNIYDDNYDEIDITFPQLEWEIEFE